MIKEYKENIQALREYLKVTFGKYPNRIIMSVKLRMELKDRQTFMGMIIETNEDFEDNKIYVCIKE